MLPFFSAACYLDIIRSQLELNSSVKGYKSLLAKAAGFHTSYLSHVLSERAHISPEQAIAICDFWGFNAIHTDFFLALLNKERAGSDRLRKKFELDLERIRLEAENSLIVMSPKEITKIDLRPDQVLFYLSNWFAVSVHMALRIPELRTVKALSTRFLLTEAQIEDTLQKLLEMDVVSVTENVWTFKNFADVGESQGGYPKVMHNTMRQRANALLENKKTDDVFSTWVVASSQKEIAEIRAAFQEIIKNRLKGSFDYPEEELVCLCLDFFVV
ncbi:MAG: DUF4423 domain-containing protein [Proteobacteria bacterium]|nr:MAG: DUF4423 domain-containing protein [Pseudomonadota bacterium]